MLILWLKPNFKIKELFSIKALKPIPFKNNVNLKPCKIPLIWILINLVYKLIILFFFFLILKFNNNLFFLIKKLILLINFKEIKFEEVLKKSIFFFLTFSQ